MFHLGLWEMIIILVLIHYVYAWMCRREKRMDQSAQCTPADVERLERLAFRLEERVRNLETIVTERHEVESEK